MKLKMIALFFPIPLSSEIDMRGRTFDTRRFVGGFHVVHAELSPVILSESEETTIV